jgi:hypothetical protein
VKEDLGLSKSKIHISFDLWTSTNKLAMLGVVATLPDEGPDSQIPFDWSQRGYWSSFWRKYSSVRTASD